MHESISELQKKVRYIHEIVALEYKDVLLVRLVHSWKCQIFYIYLYLRRRCFWQEKSLREQNDTLAKKVHVRALSMHIYRHFMPSSFMQTSDTN